MHAGVALAFLLGACLAGAPCSAGPAEPGPCDPSLPAPPGNPLAYRLRGDRCEGVYAKPVASTSLRVVSVTAAFGDYKLDSVEPLAISWGPANWSSETAAGACGSASTTAPSGIHLRAQSLQPRVYYRMDAIRPSGEADYRWPNDTLSALGIQRAALGVLGWTTHAVDGVQRPVYLPVRIRQGSSASPEPESEYRALVTPGSELQEVYVTLARLDAQGQPSAWLRRGEALGYGYYPAERPIRIVLPLGHAPGCYRLEVTANLRGGGTTATAIWLYDAWP